MGKKVKKTIVKFDLGHQFAKKMGLPDPVGDAVYGDYKALSPAEQSAKMLEDSMKSTGTQAPDAPPTAVSEGTLEAREAQRKRQLAAAGLSATNLTGAGGLSGAANTTNKTLLGS
jgi:hypothetical protein